MTLEEIRGLLEKASPWPWSAEHGGDVASAAGYIVADFVPRSEDRALIAAAPELAALLVRAVEGLRVIRDAGGTTTDEGLSCNGTWCAEQARSLLRALEVEA